MSSELPDVVGNSEPSDVVGNSPKRIVRAKNNIKLEKRAIRPRRERARLSQGFLSLVTDKFTCLLWALVLLVFYLIAAVCMQNLETGGSPSSDPLRTWDDFAQSIFFVFTVSTTIGYGSLYPQYAGSKVFVLFFALFGIPLTVKISTNFGKCASKSFQRLLEIGVIGSGSEKKYEKLWSEANITRGDRVQRCSFAEARDLIGGESYDCEEGEEGLTKEEVFLFLDAKVPIFLCGKQRGADRRLDLFDDIHDRADEQIEAEKVKVEDARQKATENNEQRKNQVSPEPWDEIQAAEENFLLFKEQIARRVQLAKEAALDKLLVEFGRPVKMVSEWVNMGPQEFADFFEFLEEKDCVDNDLTSRGTLTVFATLLLVFCFAAMGISYFESRNVLPPFSYCIFDASNNCAPADPTLMNFPVVSPPDSCTCVNGPVEVPNPNNLPTYSVENGGGVSNEWNFGNSFYFLCITVFTIGLGDFVPDTRPGMVITVIATLFCLGLLTTFMETIYNWSMRSIESLDEALAEHDVGGSYTRFVNIMNKTQEGIARADMAVSSGVGKATQKALGGARKSIVTSSLQKN